MANNAPLGTNDQIIRIFFAIFPNKTIQSLLDDQAKYLLPLCAGRKVKKQNIHLTLLFLGNVMPERIAELRRIARTVSIKSFELNLEEIRYWKHNRIVYIKAKQFPEELSMLVDSLTGHLSAAGFLIDKRIYKPHITLIRNAIRPVTINLNNPIRWTIDEWGLIQSLQADKGVHYVTLDQWHLNQSSLTN